MEKKVFISYSHDSLEHKDRVLDLSDRLRSEGVDCILDQYEEAPPEGWPRWMDRNTKDVDFVLMICTESYYRRVMGEEETGTGLGVKWEGNSIYNYIYEADTTNSRFLPVLFSPADKQFIPTPLKGATYYCVGSEEGYEDLYRRLTNQPKTEKPVLGKLRKLPTRERKQDFRPPRLYLAKLPPTDHEIFGREKELGWLDEAWADPHTNIFSLVAWGGVGKTALVNSWLNILEKDNYRGAERVYGWSFYSQGTREERQVSADEFFADALEWFGYEGEPFASQWDKGRQLAELVRQKRSLLILDGLEPLQYPPGELQGRLKDQGMQALIKDLARANPGLCVLTTRVKVEDLEPTVDNTTHRIFLEDLSPEAGAELLQKLGVHGTQKELTDAAEEFEGHALALNLLGSYLATVHEGEIRKRDLIPHLTEEEEKGGHARRVMASYEKWLKGTPELNILYLMGLFDRPAEAGGLDKLRAEPPIDGLTDDLRNLSHAKWQYAVKHLRELRLLGAKDETRPDTLDCHPLVREHFGEQLQESNLDAWREAHSRLYDYYRELPDKEYPDTLAEMEPLYAAVAHGCMAGKHRDALYDVYWTRIKRGEKHFSTRKLGAFGADLAAVANFFQTLWVKPVDGLTDSDKSAVLSWAGFRLRAVGRLRQAAKLMQTGMETSIADEDWEGAAKDAINLGELNLTLGEVRQAVDCARQGVDFGDRSGDRFHREAARTALADALHQAGEIKEAERLFREAEAMQQERQPEYPCLYSLRGFQFCDLLLSRGQVPEVQERAGQTLQWARSHGLALLTVALDTLSLGRTHFLEAQAEDTKDYAKALDYLKKAVAVLREAGTQVYLPRGLLARAAVYRMQKNFAAARDDLNEVQEIAERGEMGLHMADYRLEACRLCLAEGRTEDANKHLATAEKMIAEMGYHRRDKEVKELRGELDTP